MCLRFFKVWLKSSNAPNKQLNRSENLQILAKNLLRKPHPQSFYPICLSTFATEMLKLHLTNRISEET